MMSSKVPTRCQSTRKYDSQPPSKVTDSSTWSGSTTATRTDWIFPTRSTPSENARNNEYSCAELRPLFKVLSRRLTRVL